MKEAAQLYNLEAEMSVLGAMILNEAAAERVLSYLQESDFYFAAHRPIFRAMHGLWVRRKSIDLITLTDALRTARLLEEAGGEDYLIETAESVPSAANAMYYAGIVKDKATLRGLNTAGHEIVKLSTDPDLRPEEVVQLAEDLVFRIGGGAPEETLYSMPALAMRYTDRLHAVVEGKQVDHGPTTGLYDLDALLVGFRPGTLAVVAARPGMGKTSFACQVAINIARKAGRVLIFSLEMPADDIAERIITQVGGMSTKLGAKVDEDTYRKLSNAAELAYNLGIHVDDKSGASVPYVASVARRLIKEFGGLACIIVDFLQRMSAPKRRGPENRVQEVSLISRGLADLAKDLGVPVIALSQLSRAAETRTDKRPQLSDLRESGDIEADAAVVIGLYRDNYYTKEDANPDRTEEAEAIVLKNRYGDTGTAKVAFIPRTTSYMSLVR